MKLALYSLFADTSSMHNGDDAERARIRAWYSQHWLLLSMIDGFARAYKVPIENYCRWDDTGGPARFQRPEGCLSSIVFERDDLCLMAAEDTGTYPVGVAMDLLDKTRLGPFLSNHGFDTLYAKRVYGVDAINIEDFIIKPVIATGQAKPFTHFADGNPAPFFCYKRYHNAAELEAEAAARNEDLQTWLATGEYLVQEANMNPQWRLLSIGGAVNENSDVLFWRHADTRREDPERRLQMVRTFSGAENEKALLREFVKTVMIRNTAFMVQFLQVGNRSVFIDWNFRIPPRWMVDCDRVDPNEFYRAMCHMLDIKTSLPDVFPGDWVLDCSSVVEGVDGAVHGDLPIRVVP